MTKSGPDGRSSNFSFDICVLVPNGLMVELTVQRETTLNQVKEDFFDKSSRLPLFGHLKQDLSRYMFTYVSASNGLVEDVNDEDVTFCNIDPFQGVLKLVEKRNNEDENRLNVQIGKLIGVGLHEFDALKCPEINDFRWRMSILSSDAEIERGEMNWEQLLDYQFPPRIVRHEKIPPYIQQKLLTKYETIVELRFGKMCQSFKVNPNNSVNAVIDMAMKILAPRYSQQLGEEPNKYILKVCGVNEYLKNEEPLINYCDMLASGKSPSFIITSVESLQQTNEHLYDPVIECIRRPSISHGKKRVQFILADSIKEKLTITVNYAGPLVTSTIGTGKFGVMAGVYNGMESLATPLSTDVVFETNEMCLWDQKLEFDIEISNLTQMARFCFMLYEVQSSKPEPSPVSWVNLTVFSYLNELRNGSYGLETWPYNTDIKLVDWLNPDGVCAINPNSDESAILTVTIHSPKEAPICFSPSPHMTPVVSRFPFGTENVEEETYISMVEENRTENDQEEGIGKRKNSASKMHMDQLREIVEKKPVSEITEQDRELFRILRHSCRELLPKSLPYVLTSVKWFEKSDVREMMNLLKHWPPIPPENALCLLSSDFPALEVRTFACKCLEILSDEHLLLYLLQLVQALKNETFWFNNLAKFLISRALKSQVIGHHLFWLLRSEMHDPAVRIYFGLLLETYCRGASDHIAILTKQLDSMTQLKRLNDLFRQEINRRSMTREKQKQFLIELLGQQFFTSLLSEITCPYNPRLVLSKLRVDKCNSMDSKMKPLLLVFSNKDVGAEDVSIIYKNGDDLRQDILILQMLRIFDYIWKQEGFDFRLCPYTVVSTGEKVGLIEVVKNSQTIANIQKEYSPKASAFKKGSLLKWLKAQNTDPESLKQAINEFTLSCAGYCVATYVLGIADRHSDNIMVKTNGQLFHIDFGHILGKFKEKFGIRRERVPFVLTHDFVYVVTQGDKVESNMKKFRNFCESAFMILRKRGPFIMSLFTLMLAAGIPEIADSSDLNYLRENLDLEVQDSDALARFRSKFTEAEGGSMKTSLNWWVHNISKSNK